MQKTKSRLTVYFEDPFWVGVYERESDGKLEVCKITFGAQPKEYDVYEYLQKHWHTLRFGPPVTAGEESLVKRNPKRIQREITKQLQNTGAGTKAQQALMLRQEEGKAARKKQNSKQREAEKQAQFELRQQKKKEKHKGH